MNDLAIALISTIFGGGTLTGLYQLIKGRSERRHVEAQAAALGATTPAQVESLSMATMREALNGARSINEDYKKTNDELKKDLAELKVLVEQVRQEADGSYQAMQLEIGTLRRALQSAEDYVTDLLDWIARNLPGAQPPQRRRAVFVDRNTAE